LPGFLPIKGFLPPAMIAAPGVFFAGEGK